MDKHTPDMAAEYKAERDEFENECIRLTQRLDEEIKARNALEGDRTELQAKAAHLEQKLQANIGARDYWTQCERADRLLAEKKELVEALEHILDNSKPINGGPFYIYDEYRYTQKVQEQVRALLARLK